MMKALSDIPPSERDNWKADIGQMLVDGDLTEEQAADLFFGPSPLAAWLASKLEEVSSYDQR